MKFDEFPWSSSMSSLLNGQFNPSLVCARGSPPFHRQICDQLRSAILEGRLRAGQRLPSSRELAAALGVARNTVSSALGQLAMEGFIGISQGRRPEVVALRTFPDAGIRSDKVNPASLPRPSRWARTMDSGDWPFLHEPRGVPLAPGIADAREFPHDLWARCLRSGARRAGTPDASDLNRGRLRQALLAHLAQARGLRAEPHRIFLMPSAQAALDLCARLVMGPGDIGWMEDPGYGGARVAMRNAGATVRGIGVDQEGMTVCGQRSRPKAIFVTPSHQYPTGVLMSAGRRHELLRVAMEAGAAIIEDDYDSEFHFDGRPVAALQGMDAAGRVFYVGTFSKAMFSDIRIGYAVVPESFAGPFALAQRQTGQIVAPTLQEGLARFIERGHLAAHIRRMNGIYRTRRDSLVDLLRTHLSDRLSVQVPAGGMQIQALFTRTMDDIEVVRHLAERNICARPLSSHYSRAPVRQGLFLGFAAWRPDEMSSAIAELKQVLSLPGRRRPVRRRDQRAGTSIGGLEVDQD
ncbi:MAG: PLP-dependent aminotransferase family protein [Rhodocyclaceae bacterium]|nr:PLP-dependent aminotransferase family protein [Rhodocyclaceae bacterium]